MVFIHGIYTASPLMLTSVLYTLCESSIYHGNQYLALRLYPVIIQVHVHVHTNHEWIPVQIYG